MSESMNPENIELSPKQLSALQALALSNIEEGMGKMLQELQGCRKSLCKGEPHSYKIQLRLKLLKAKKLYWQELYKKKLHIGHKYQSCHIYIFHRLRRLKLSPKRSSDCLLFWRDSKLSWNRSRNNNRVVSLRCLGFSQLHPG